MGEEDGEEILCDGFCCDRVDTMGVVGGTEIFEWGKEEVLAE